MKSILSVLFISVLFTCGAEELRELNRLKHEASPYLRQHATNPVDWYPWGDEALEKAKKEGKPIFLSIGYSACHWCHVMEEESFEDEEIAAFLNKHFVNIKVDREERPDLDKIYMKSVQMMTGRGGWPMTVFMTPEGEPFFGGTYFPPQEVQGHPGFMPLIKQLEEIWRTDRPRVETIAKQVTDNLKTLLDVNLEPVDLPDNLERSVILGYVDYFDEEYGGFSRAPKFPRPTRLRYFLKKAVAYQDYALKEKTLKTLDMMAQSGMYDHVGGGFHRYAVDVEWRVPHFEKMLYDNAQLPQLYLDAWMMTKKPFYKKVIDESYDYIIRDMLDESTGLFYSSEDADSEKVEGKFYVWSYEELKSLISSEEFSLFVKVFGIKEQGNFSSHETPNMNVLHIGKDIDTLLVDLEISEEKYWSLRKAWQKRLFEVRKKRIHPRKDDKVLTSWNSLMIASMARSGRELNNSKYSEIAIKAGESLWEKMFKDEELHRVYHQGVVKGSAYLDDYAYFILANIELYKLKEDKKFLNRALLLWKKVQEGFSAKNGMAFYYRNNKDKLLVSRSRDFLDSAIPNANASLALALKEFYAITNDKSYKDAQLKLIKAASGQLSEKAYTAIMFMLVLD